MNEEESIHNLALWCFQNIDICSTTTMQNVRKCYFSTQIENKVQKKLRNFELKQISFIQFPGRVSAVGGFILAKASFFENIFRKK